MGQAAPPRHARRIRLLIWGLLALVVAAHVVVAFAPFRYDPPRHVSNGASLDDGVLRITGPADAKTAAAPAWLRQVREGADLAVALEVRPTRSVQGGPARILTVEADYEHADILVGQDGDDLVLRVRRPESAPSGDPPITVADVFAEPGWHRIGLSTTDGELTIAVDDREPVTVPIGPDGLSGWDVDYRLAIGDSVLGNRSWDGDVRVATAGAEAEPVDYLAAGELEIPDEVWYRPSRLDDVVGLDADHGLLIAVAHFLSFLPVGALVAALCVRRRLQFGTLWSAGLALFLQAGKVVFDGRHPALVDVVVETLGGFVGAWAWVRFSPSPAPAPDDRQVIDDRVSTR